MDLGHGSWSNKEQASSKHAKSQRNTTMTFIVYNYQAFWLTNLSLLNTVLIYWIGSGRRTFNLKHFAQNWGRSGCCYMVLNGFYWFDTNILLRITANFLDQISKSSFQKSLLRYLISVAMPNSVRKDCASSSGKARPAPHLDNITNSGDVKPSTPGDKNTWREPFFFYLKEIYR